MYRKKNAYPIVISKEADGFYYVEIPDFNIATQGKDIADSMEMARDAIGLMGIDFIDDGKEIPQPNSTPIKPSKNDIVTLVDVDFGEYRKKADNKAVKKNCTIPYWLNVEAEKAGINYSKVLQDAIINILGLKKMLINLKKESTLPDGRVLFLFSVKLIIVPYSYSVISYFHIT